VHHGRCAGAARVECLRDCLASHPGHVGIAIDDETALVVRERRGRVIGTATVRLCLAEGGGRPARVDRVPHGSNLDMIQLSRAAVVRAATAPVASIDGPAEVGAGTLFLGGGDEVQADILRRFIEAAGGPDAPIVVIPTASERPEPLEAGRRDARLLKRAGAQSVTVVHARTPGEAGTRAVLEPLRTARGIWFSSGHSWRLVDVYLDTVAHDLMKRVLDRGGAIGGTRGGATIQAGYLARGDPFDDRAVMAEGYERGFGFLAGAAVDLQFTQRNRATDMVSLKRAHPQLVGIGIDEGAIAIIHENVLEAAGMNRILLYEAVSAAFTVLEAGDRYDLRSQRVVRSRPEPRRP
jgi:cyanophycinase